MKLKYGRCKYCSAEGNTDSLVNEGLCGSAKCDKKAKEEARDHQMYDDK